MKNTAVFLNPSVLYSKSDENHLIITLEAPAVDASEKRRPLCIIAAIDVSSSMSGPKMDYAKKSVIKLIDHLMPGDYLGVVTFGSTATLVAPPVEVTHDQKERMKLVVGDLFASGNTNFSGGLILAMESVNKLDLSAEYISRVIMFTDGQANSGIATKSADIVALAKSNRGGISVSGFGYGDGCDNDMLSDLASGCDGNFAFIANPDDALAAFGKELGGLSSVYAQDLVIDVRPLGGHEIVQVLNDVDVEQTGDGVRIKLSDILSEEKRNIVISMNLLKQKKAGPREVNVVDVSMTYKLVEGGKVTSRDSAFKAKVKFSSEVTPSPDKALNAVVGLAKLSNAQVEAEKLAKAGSFAAAENFMRSTSEKFAAAGLENLANVTRTLGTSYSSGSSYGSSSAMRMSSRGLMDRTASVSSASPMASIAYNSVLSDAGVSLSNSTQTATTASFSGSIAPSVVLSDSLAVDLKSVKSPIAVKTPSKPRTKEKSGRW